MERLIGRKHLFLVIFLCLVIVSAGCKVVGLPDINPPKPGENNSDDDPVEDPNLELGSLIGTVQDAALPEAKFQSGQAAVNGQLIQIKNGTYKFDNIPNGTYKLSITKQWYRPMEIQVLVTGPTMQNVHMTPSLTLAELDLLARLVYAEAKGEIYQGQVAVASTILNRVLDSRYPNTVSGVINQVIVQNGIRYYQYEPVKNGSINIPANQSAKNAVRHALAGWDPTMGATGFFAHAKVPQRSNGKVPWVWQQWNQDPYKIRIGNHSFFR